MSSKLRNLSVVVLVEAAIRKGPVVHDAEDDSALRERAGTRAPGKVTQLPTWSPNFRLEPPQMGCEFQKDWYDSIAIDASVYVVCGSMMNDVMVMVCNTDYPWTKAFQRKRAYERTMWAQLGLWKCGALDCPWGIRRRLFKSVLDPGIRRWETGWVGTS